MVAVRNWGSAMNQNTAFCDYRNTSLTTIRQELLGLSATLTCWLVPDFTVLITQLEVVLLSLKHG